MREREEYEEYHRRKMQEQQEREEEEEKIVFMEGYSDFAKVLTIGLGTFIGETMFCIIEKECRENILELIYENFFMPHY